MRWENLGHSDVLTTFFSYGEVPGRRRSRGIIAGGGIVLDISQKPIGGHGGGRAAARIWHPAGGFQRRHAVPNDPDSLLSWIIREVTNSLLSTTNSLIDTGAFRLRLRCG